MWLRFRKHKLAKVGLAVLAAMYLIAIFADFFSPYDPNQRMQGYRAAPPQRIRFIDSEGNFHLRPFVYGMEQRRNPQTLQTTYTEVKDSILPIYFFAKGPPYKLWGLFECDRRLFGIADQDDSGRTLFLLGSDRLARDLLSQIFFGSRISLSIGLVGVFISFLLGITIGGISGYFGGMVDNVIQRSIESIRSFPTIPLWLALSAALPPRWPMLKVYFAITIILSIIGWTGMARVVRGKFLSLREEEYVLAAKVAGAGVPRLLFKHMLPGFYSHVIAAATLAVPRMILAETTLSFLGLGLRPPAISWGVLLSVAQNLYVVIESPWLMLPGVFVIITVLAFNFVGDGLRDAADPYQ